MNRIMKYFTFLIFCLAAACSEESNSGTDMPLTDQIDDLVVSSEYNAADLPGETNTEKLLYLMDFPTSVQTATLVIADSQITMFENAGNLEQANELRRNREAMMEVLRDETPSLVSIVSPAYEKHLKEDEIAKLVELFSDPAAQKLFKSNAEITKDVIPAVEKWSKEIEDDLAAAISAKSE